MDNRIRIGMTVFSADGERLGKIVRAEENTVVIEKGFFFPTDFFCKPEDIANVRSDDEVVLRLSRAELESGSTSEGSGSIEQDRIGQQGFGRERTGASTQAESELTGAPQLREQSRASASASSGQTQQETRIPVVQEELDVQKRTRQRGQVKITKSIVEEQKQVTVPVMREEVRVERVPADGTTSGEARFENSSVTVPVMEEEIEIVKRPVVKEEVRISKTAHVEQRSVNETVRRENVEVKEEDDDDVETGTGYRPGKDDSDKHV